jgi:putative radical SAM enzyme (TIGR03279 family)
MVKITSVTKNSRAFRAGILAEDILLTINGREISDVLDYRFFLTDSSVTLELMRGEEKYSVNIRKQQYDDIGLEFETPLMDKKHSCHNKCIFCFIDQLPKGMRETLYFKDDDSRLSFLHGNYITLTNLQKKDIDRIIEMHISPINVSVHTTNPELRIKMMHNKRAGEVLEYMTYLKEAGISLCGQIVLCRGINDGDELLRSMRDLSKLFPEMQSVSIVPAGLTKYREKLYPLTEYTREEAAKVIATVDKFAEEMKKQHGQRMFFCADELYLKAGLPLHGEEYYEEYVADNAREIGA